MNVNRLGSALFNLLRKLVKRIAYQPARHFERLAFATKSDTSIILNSASFSFHAGHESFKGKLQLGAECMVGCAFIFESDQGAISIGERTFINGGTQLISRTGISIGNDVTIAWGCTIYDHNSHSLSFAERRNDIRRQIDDHKNGKNFIASKDWSTVKSAPIIIQNDAWIGFNVIILSGVTIGEGAIVGAGSVVRENVEPWTIVAGNPAVFLKRIEK